MLIFSTREFYFFKVIYQLLLIGWRYSILQKHSMVTLSRGTFGSIKSETWTVFLIMDVSKPTPNFKGSKTLCQLAPPPLFQSPITETFTHNYSCHFYSLVSLSLHSGQRFATLHWNEGKIIAQYVLKQVFLKKKKLITKTPKNVMLALLLVFRDAKSLLFRSFIRINLNLRFDEKLPS